jgi:hypothetical protein
MVADFKTAKKDTENQQLKIEYRCCKWLLLRKGQQTGQRFWEFISGDADLFTEIIEPLGHKAKEKNDVFIESYSQMINKFTKEFANVFCKDTGEIDWDKLVRFNSANEEPKERK